MDCRLAKAMHAKGRLSLWQLSRQCHYLHVSTGPEWAQQDWVDWAQQQHVLPEC
jgi:hypothetical protein